MFTVDHRSRLAIGETWLLARDYLAISVYQIATLLFAKYVSEVVMAVHQGITDAPRPEHLRVSQIPKVKLGFN
jgi:hypothetical protein